MHYPITIKASPQKISIKNLAFDFGPISKKELLKHNTKIIPSRVKISSEINRINIQQAFKLNHDTLPVNTTSSLQSLKQKDVLKNKAKIQLFSPTRYKSLGSQQRPTEKNQYKFNDQAKQTNYKFFPKRDSPVKTKSHHKILFSKKQIQQQAIDLKYWNIGEAQRQFFRLYSASSHQIKGKKFAKPRVKSTHPNQNKSFDKQIGLTPWVSQKEDEHNF